MADSKFLKFQDIDGDGLQEICKDIVPVAHTPKCPDCVPNPTYVGPNWRNQTEDEPWFDEKNCKYKVTIKTSYDRTTPSPEASDEEAASFMAEMYREYAETAIDAILLAYERQNTPEVRQFLVQYLNNEKYDLDPRQFSRVKLLFSINYDYIASLDAADVDDEPEEETDDPTGQDESVKFNASSLKPKLQKVAKVMRYYARLYRVHQYVNESSLVFKDGRVYSTRQMDRYGLERSVSQGGGGAMVNMFNQLDNWLNSKGYCILEAQDWGSITATQRVKDLEFVFTGRKKLKELRVWTYKCKNEPTVFKGKQIRALNKRSSWKDPTVCNYLIKADKILASATARVERPFIQVLEENTYPEVKEIKRYGYKESSNAGAGGELDSGGFERTAMSCLGDNLKGEFKQLGQDILDDVLSLGDALAAAFHDAICKASLGEKIDEDLVKGVLNDPRFNAFEATEIYDATTVEDKTRAKNIDALSVEQAFANFDADENLFATVCVNVLGSAVGRSNQGWPTFDFGKIGSAQIFLDDAYKYGFDRMKICGLFDFLSEGLRCLLGGLTLEEALTRVVKSALDAMGVEDFGKLFIGLPPEKQAELDALVKRKIEEGNLIEVQNGEGVQVWSGWKPWENKEVVDNERDKKSQNNKAQYEGMSTKDMQEYSPGNRRTLAQQFDPKQVQESAANQLSPDVIMEAYVLALIEVYGDNLLSLVDKLNDFPGAPIVSFVFATLDCPRPPLFDPNFLDFVNSLQIPICKFPNELVLPKLINPFGWLPSLRDIAKLLFMLLIWAVQTILMMVIMRIIQKLCELLGDAICKALEIMGKAAASLATGGASLGDIIRDSICGPDATPEQTTDTLAETGEKLGMGGAALSNKKEVERFFSDVSNSVTREELFVSLTSDTPAAMGTVVDNLIEYEYPQFRDALPNAEAISDFFGNIGNCLPEAVKNQMKQFLSDLPDDDEMPANPSLCLSQEDVDEFQDIRCALLEGRATSEQCRAMFDNRQLDLLDDLESLADVLQNPQKVLMDAMPPIISEPGCDNGLIPFESDEMLQAASVAMGGAFKQLKIDFTQDMIGPSEPGRNDGRYNSKWGMMNMIMSDTLGNPLSVHWVKAPTQFGYTNFVTKQPDGFDEGMFAGLYPGGFVQFQKGQFPSEVAGHLQDVMGSVSTNFQAHNNFKEDEQFKKSFTQLGWGDLFNNSEFSLISLPDFGYNTNFSVNVQGGFLLINKPGRKASPDILIDYEDNNTGVVTPITPGETKPWSYGFRVGVYHSDLQENSNVGTAGEPRDLTRVKITHKFNTSGKIQGLDLQSISPDYYKDLMLRAKGSVYYDRYAEFAAEDNTLQNLPNNKYERFRECFEQKTDIFPQIVLLAELLKENNGDITSTSEAISLVDINYDNFMSHMYDTVFKEVANNQNAFRYGAVNDPLSESDTDYGIDNDGVFVNYEDARNENGDQLSNDDMVLGISRDAFNNKDNPKNIRVHYLDPKKYGGSYTNPPLYIKPMSQEGWMGFLSVLFPEYTVCKPRRTELIDFDSIQDEVDESYNKIPLDPRLKEDRTCVIERPYNRVLDRPAIATIQGIIKATCRIYASTHMIKSLATMTTFYPDFDNMYSNIYAAYIVEDMEKGLKDPAGPWHNGYNPFADNELWYSFLEQVVQTYGRLVDEGEINPSDHILNTLFKLNDGQDGFKYPQMRDLKVANELGETDLPVKPTTVQNKSLESYRKKKNLEHIQATEELAKIILQDMISQELNVVGKKMIENIETLELKPKYKDAGKYFVSNFTVGGIDLNLHDDLKEEVIGLPTSGSGYTTGGEFSVLSSGEPYEGYYHVHIDEDGETVYMEGEHHIEDDHETIIPVLSKMGIPFGDIVELNLSTTSYDAKKPFLIEKYISINGQKYAPNEAIPLITAKGDRNISDVYPGDMKLVYPPVVEGEPVPEDPAPVGVSGNLGIMYGMQISYVQGTSKSVIASTEISALDTLCSAIPPLEANGKLLFCLLNNLMNEEEFKLLINYIFPIKKVISTVAIYNDMGFLPSIGELTVSSGNSFPSPSIGAGSATFESKPGMKISSQTTTVNSDGTSQTSYVYEETRGWSSYNDRQPGPYDSQLYNHWDNWDKELLRNSRNRLKKIFRNAYNDRDFDLSGGTSSGNDAASYTLKKSMSGMVPQNGPYVLPWWKKSKIRPNPFDKNGNECSPVPQD